MKKKVISVIMICCFMLSACATNKGNMITKDIKETESEASDIQEREMGEIIEEGENKILITDLKKDFYSDENWFEVGGKIEQIDGSGQLKSDSEEIAEAWYQYKDNLPASEDFSISAEVKVPRYWDSNGKENGQVGVGIFVGKACNEGKLVFECDLCTIKDSERFVQGQMIKNRKGGEPNEVDYKAVIDESGLMEIQYKAAEHMLVLVFNDEIISSQKIDKTGSVNWEMKENDDFVIGFMGFSEWVKIESEYPTIQNIRIAK